MGGGVSKPKKVTPDRAEATAAILSALEANLPDEEVAAKCKEKRNIDASFRMNLMYHEEDGWGLLHVAASSRYAPPPSHCSWPVAGMLPPLLLLPLPLPPLPLLPPHCVLTLAWCCACLAGWAATGL